jgi:hypothetical protein
VSAFIVSVVGRAADWFLGREVSMTDLANSPAFYGLIVVSLFFGVVISFIVYVWLVRATGATFQDTLGARDWYYAGFLTGVFERFFFTCAVGLLGAGGTGVMTAMIGWIAVKGQVHYKMFTDTNNQDHLPQIYLGLLGSLTSLLLAILGGYLWDGGYALSHPFVGKPGP